MKKVILNGVDTTVRLKQYPPVLPTVQQIDAFEIALEQNDEMNIRKNSSVRKGSRGTASN